MQFSQNISAQQVRSMRGAIQLKMIGWELTQNNNIICRFLRILNYFSSTSAINSKLLLEYFY